MGLIHVWMDAAAMTNPQTQKVAAAIYDKWHAEMEDEETEEWADYGDKEWFLAMASAAIAAMTPDKRLEVAEKALENAATLSCECDEISDGEKCVSCNAKQALAAIRGKHGN